MIASLLSVRRLAQSTLPGAALVALAVLQSSAAEAANTAQVDLNFFIQNDVITNSPTSSDPITVFIYSLGTPEDNLATWQDTGGGTASDFLSDPQYFQTVSFSGLSVVPGSTFSFSGLDMDLIQTLIPLSVTGSTLGGPETLRNASVSVIFNTGETGSIPLCSRIGTRPRALQSPRFLPPCLSSVLLLPSVIAAS